MKAGDLVASKYRLIARLGQGGMGAVWSAANVQTGKEFAIKFLHPLVASSSEDARQRFMQEARASARMNHPNIIDIFDVGETDDGALFLVMELLDGISLQDAMRSDPPFSARELLIIAVGTATALGIAHAAGIVHRDVKPPNIYLCRDRNSALVKPKLLDFGVSKVALGDDGIATHTGSLLGSPRYMSPEQAISASQADGRADLWSLGVILYEGLTGVFPHEGDNSNAIVIAIAMKPPRPITEVAPYLPLSLRELVDDCLKPVASRVQTAYILADRLREILATHDLSDVPLARPAHAKKVIARPDNFVIETASGSQPGLQSMLTAGQVGMTTAAVRASLAGVPPPPAALAPAAKPISLRPPPPRAPVIDDEDATIIRVDPREFPPDVSARDSEPTAVTNIEPFASPSDPLSKGPEPRANAPESRPGQDREHGLPLVYGLEGGQPQLDPSNVQAPPTSAPIAIPHAPADPGESISSINVSRGLTGGSVPPIPLRTFISDPPEAPLKSKKPIIVAIAALGAVSLMAIIVILSVGGSASKTSAAGSAAPSARPAKPVERAAETAQSEQPTASAPGASAVPTASTSASSAPSAAKPAETSKAQGGDQVNQPKPKPTGTDPLRDLGSGIKMPPKKK